MLFFCSLLSSLSALASSQQYIVEDINNLNLYLWNGSDVKERMLIGYNLSGGMDFNATTGIICGGGASSYLWVANVKSGVKKMLFPSRDVYSSVAPINNVIVSSNDGHCVFTDGVNIYSYSMNNSVSKVNFSGAKLDASEKPRRVFLTIKAI